MGSPEIIYTETHKTESVRCTYICVYIHIYASKYNKEIEAMNLRVKEHMRVGGTRSGRG